MKRNRWQPNPDRFIWNNNGTYWLRWTPYDPVYKQARMAASLGTADLEEARRKRDEIVANWNREEAYAQ
jgi:hypothetical protein